MALKYLGRALAVSLELAGPRELRGSQGGTVGILGVTGGILWGLNGIQGGTGGILGGLNGIQGGTGVFLAEKFESPTRCLESLAPPIGPRPVELVQSLLERMACPAQTSIYATKAATKAGKALLFLALRWIINLFHGLGLALLFCPSGKLNWMMES